MKKDLQNYEPLSITQLDDKARIKWLRQSTNCFSVVLNDSSIDCFKNAKFIVKQFMCCIECKPIFIAVCKHDKDFDDINQRLETPHYQCIVVFNDSMQFKSMIKLIQNLFKGCNENQIGLEKVNSVYKMTRYVVHRGFFDKYQYSLEEMETNNIDLFMQYYNMTEIQDNNDCVVVVKQYHYNLEEIISHVSNYNKYRSIIKDLITENRFKGRY